MLLRVFAGGVEDVECMNPVSWLPKSIYKLVLSPIVEV